MFSRDELLKLDLYLNRPAKELIFVTRSEHLKIHCEDCAKGGTITMRKMTFEQRSKGGKKSAKSILQYTKAGEVVKEWASASEVQRQTGINQGNISSCCRGCREFAGGFVWRFK